METKIIASEAIQVDEEREVKGLKKRNGNEAIFDDVTKKKKRKHRSRSIPLPCQFQSACILRRSAEYEELKPMFHQAMLEQLEKK